MTQPLFELLIPAKGRVMDEDFYVSIETGLRQIARNPVDRKRLLVVAMEMFQNLVRHGLHNRISLLRIRKTRDSGYRISSLNFANEESSRCLSGKHAKLSGVDDHRKNFRDKLLRKLQIKEPAGNLGLDICFRNSRESKLRLIPSDNNQNLIFLSFSLENHGKSAA
jgi:hypothetical protein